ncbi:hypothetical protein [Saccharothrix hoggarensis]|uniref:Uncharacterized protein n=1 Tax=Saccharothrix hoggarensis TaxID=913853 RepID=A0ABW3QS64_9PSEU
MFAYSTVASVRRVADLAHFLRDVLDRAALDVSSAIHTDSLLVHCVIDGSSMSNISTSLIAVAAEEPKWTDVGTFIVAVIAFIVASVAAWATVMTNRYQAEQLTRLENSDKERQEQDRRKQAENIWAIADENGLVSIYNSSNAPIWDVRAEVCYKSSIPQPIRLSDSRDYIIEGVFLFDPIAHLLPNSMPNTGVVAPGYEGLRDKIGEEVSKNLGAVHNREKLLESGHEPAFFGVSGGTALEMAKACGQSIADNGVKLTFRDLAGTSWTRHPDGRLELASTTHA